MKLSIFAGLVAVLTLVSGCAGRGSLSMPDGLPAPQIPTVAVDRQSLSADYKPSAHVAKVKDQRFSPALIKDLAGREESTTSDLGLSVEYAMKKAVRSRGFTVSDKAAVALAIKIDKWVATKKENEIVYEAAVTADIIGPSGGSIYTNAFDSYSTSATALSDDAILSKLGSTMAESLAQILRDENLINVMSSY